MIPFRSKSVTQSMLIDLLTSRRRSTQVKLYTGLIASIDLWPQEMFTFSEMLALVQSESSFGAYVCHRRPAGLHSDQRSCYERSLHEKYDKGGHLNQRRSLYNSLFPAHQSQTKYFRKTFRQIYLWPHQLQKNEWHSFFVTDEARSTSGETSF